MVLSKKSQRILDKFRKEAIALKQLLVSQGIHLTSGCLKPEQDRQLIEYFNNFIQNMNENLPENEKYQVTSNQLSRYMKDLPHNFEDADQSCDHLDVQRKMSRVYEIKEHLYINIVNEWSTKYQLLANKYWEFEMFTAIDDGQFIETHRCNRNPINKFTSMKRDILNGRFSKGSKRLVVTNKANTLLYEKKGSELMQWMTNFIDLTNREEMLWINRDEAKTVFTSASLKFNLTCYDPIVQVNLAHDTLLLERKKLKIAFSNAPIDDGWMGNVSIEKKCLYCKMPINGKTCVHITVIAREHQIRCSMADKAFTLNNTDVQVNPEHEVDPSSSLPKQSNFSIRFMNAFNMKWAILQNMIAGILDAEDSQGYHSVYMIFDEDNGDALYAGQTSALTTTLRNSNTNLHLFGFTRRPPMHFMDRMRGHLQNGSKERFRPVGDHVRKTKHGIVCILVVEFVSSQLATYLEAIIQWNMNPKLSLMPSLEFPMMDCNFKGKDGKRLSYTDMEHATAGLILRALKMGLRAKIQPVKTINNIS